MSARDIFCKVETVPLQVPDGLPFRHPSLSKHAKKERQSTLNMRNGQRILLMKSFDLCII